MVQNISTLHLRSIRKETTYSSHYRYILTCVSITAYHNIFHYDRRNFCCLLTAMLIIKILIKVCCRYAVMTKPWSSTSRKRRMRFGCWTFGGNYWFLKYKWKENLSGDVIAGVTMAIIQIPQGKTDNLGFFAVPE